MRRNSISLISLICCAAFCLSAGDLFPCDQNGASHVDGKLATAVARLGDAVAGYLKNANVAECSFGALTEIPPGGAATLGLKNAIINAIDEHGVKVVRQATYSCAGEVRYSNVNNKVVISVQISEKGALRKTCSKEVFDARDLAALVGGTASLPPKSEDRIAALLASIKNPKPEVQMSPTSSVVKAAQDGVFGMEILRTMANGSPEPVKVENEAGLLFVELGAGDAFVIRLFNNTGRLAAATVTIDGLNLFAFSENEGYTKAGKMIVPPGEKGVLLHGWHKSHTESFSLQAVRVGQAVVPELKNSRAELLQVDDGSGIVTAHFCFAVDRNDPHDKFPADEPATLCPNAARIPVIDGNAEIDAKYGIDREIISIRYDHFP